MQLRAPEANHGLHDRISVRRLTAPLAIDYAADAGRLDVVKYLHEGENGGCSQQATANAAASGYLKIVESLNQNRAEGCAPTRWITLLAMVTSRSSRSCKRAAWRAAPQAQWIAAENGHLDVLKLLHANRREGFTANALLFALRYRHLAVVEFLCGLVDNVDLGVERALQEAVFSGNLQMAKLLVPKLPYGQSLYPFLKAAVQAIHPQLVEFLYDNQSQQHEPMSFLRQAVAENERDIVYDLREHASVDELRDARQFAINLNNEGLAHTLGEYIEHRHHIAGTHTAGTLERRLMNEVHCKKEDPCNATNKRIATSSKSRH